MKETKMTGRIISNEDLVATLKALLTKSEVQMLEDYMACEAHPIGAIGQLLADALRSQARDTTRG
jgi:hypothetical protein